MHGYHGSSRHENPTLWVRAHTHAAVDSVPVIVSEYRANQTSLVHNMQSRGGAAETLEAETLEALRNLAVLTSV